MNNKSAASAEIANHRLAKPNKHTRYTHQLPDSTTTNNNKRQNKPKIFQTQHPTILSVHNDLVHAVDNGEVTILVHLTSVPLLKLQTITFFSK